MATNDPRSRKILRLPAIEVKSGLGESSIRREQAAGRFPPFRQLSPGCVGIFEDEIDAWLEARPVASADNGLGVRKAGPGRGHRKAAERDELVSTTVEALK
jgi:prophage regulatory protein